MRIGDDNDGAFFGEPRRGSLADTAAGGSRHDCNFVPKSIHLGTLLRRMLPRIDTSRTGLRGYAGHAIKEGSYGGVESIGTIEVGYVARAFEDHLLVRLANATPPV